MGNSCAGIPMDVSNHKSSRAEASVDDELKAMREESSRILHAGVSSKMLVAFARLAQRTAMQQGRPPMTTAEVCHELVRRVTRDYGCSYADLLVRIADAPENANRGEDGVEVGMGDSGDGPAGPHNLVGTAWDVGRASVYVVHAWEARFGDVVTAIEQWDKQQRAEMGVVHNTIYYWFDVFSFNQFSKAPPRQRPLAEWWCDAFHTTVRSIGHSMLVLGAPESAMPLERAWCVFELASTAINNARLTVQLTRNETKGFKEVLLRHFAKVRDNVRGVDLDRARASLPADKTCISLSFVHTKGIIAVNELVSKRLLEWLLKSAHALLEERLQECNRRACHVDLNTLDLATNVARLNLDLSRLEEAERLARLSTRLIADNRVAAPEPASPHHAAVDLSVAPTAGQAGSTPDDVPHAAPAAGGGSAAGGDSGHVAHSSPTLSPAMSIATGEPGSCEAGAVGTTERGPRRALPPVGGTIVAPVPTSTALRHQMNLARILMATHHLSEAEELLRLALDRALEHGRPGDTHPDTMEVCQLLGELLLKRAWEGDAVEGMDLVRKAAEWRAASLGPQHEETLQSLRELAAALLEKSALQPESPELGDACRLYERLSDAYAQTSGPRSRQCLEARRSLTEILIVMDQPTKAEPLMRRLLKDSTEMYGARHAETLALAYALARLITQQAPSDEAEGLLRYVLAERIESLGPGNHLTQRTWEALSEVLKKLNKEEMPAPTVDDDALEEDVPVDDSPVYSLGGTQANLGGVAAPITRPPPKGTSASSSSWRVRTSAAAVKIAPVTHGDDRSDDVRAALSAVCTPLVSKANADQAEAMRLVKEGKTEQALRLCRSALAAKEEELGRAHPSTLLTVSTLATLQRDAGEREEAERHFRRALDGQEAALGPTHPHVLFTVSNLGALLKAQGKLKEAEPLYRRALTGKEEQLGRNNFSTLLSMNNLGLLLSDMGQIEEAELLLRAAYRGMESTLGADHEATVRCHANLQTLSSQRRTFNSRSSHSERGQSSHSEHSNFAETLSARQTSRENVFPPPNPPAKEVAPGAAGSSLDRAVCTVQEGAEEDTTPQQAQTRSLVLHTEPSPTHTRVPAMEMRNLAMSPSSTAPGSAGSYGG